MTTENSLNIDARRLFTMATNILINGFYGQKPEDSKKLYKELKQGKKINAGNIRSEEKNINMPIKLELDRSEYRGRFNYPNFQQCLSSLLERYQNFHKYDQELTSLRTRTNQATGGILFNLAGSTVIDKDVNVLMMAIEPDEQRLAIRLLFMNPDQFTDTESQ